MAAKTLLTYDDYAALPDDGCRYELHAGELSVTPSPATRHQRVSLALAALLHGHVSSRSLGEVLQAPTDCILSRHTVLQPDILFIDRDRQAIVTERAVEGPPTLVVEILSPSTEGIDLGRKRALYAEHGVPWYWIVDPASRTIDALRLSTGGDWEPAGRLAGEQPRALPPLPDLTLDPAVIWR